MINADSMTVKGHPRDKQIAKRYVRTEEAKASFGMEESTLLLFANAAEALYQLPKITLICQKKLEEYMKHLYKVPGMGKYVKKKLVRVGEGSVMYSIGRNRFIEMARAAGAVYKLQSSVYVSLEAFDEYIEQFREKPVEMKKPLWKKEEV